MVKDEALWCREMFVKVCEGLYSGVEMRVVRMEGIQGGLVLRGLLGKYAFCLHFCLIFICWEWWRNWKELI